MKQIKGKLPNGFQRDYLENWGAGQMNEQWSDRLVKLFYNKCIKTKQL